jgi:hypothetical protein
MSSPASLHDPIKGFLPLNPSSGPFSFHEDAKFSSFCSTLVQHGVPITALNGALALDFLRHNIVVVDETGARQEESQQVVTQWLAKYLSISDANQVDLKLLSHHITVRLGQLEDGPIYVKSYQLIPVFEGKPTNCALTNAGLVLSGVPADCAMSSYQRTLFKFLHSGVLGAEVALELPDGYRVAARDVLNHSSKLTFVGSTYWTNEDAIRAMLQDNVFKTAKVAVVRDLFDRHLKLRPHLDSVLFALNATSFAVAEAVLGVHNMKRRLVQEYTWCADQAQYVLTVNDMELGEYLKLLNFNVLSVPASISCSSVSLLALGPGKFLAASCQADLVQYYKTNAALDNVAILTSSVDYDIDLLANSLLVRETAALASVNETSAMSYNGEIPQVHQPLTIYSDLKRRQTTNKLLMVAPIGFLSSAQTALDNYFMNKTSLPEYEVERLALAEYSNFHRALVAEGVCITLYRNERFYGTPDAVFPNNWFSTHPPAEDGRHGHSHNNKPVPSSSSTSSTPSNPKSTLCLYPMKALSRRAERREHIASDLLSRYEKVENFTYFEYQGTSGVAFEGTGSLVLDRVNKVAYCALSQRADIHVFHRWCKKMGYTPCAFTAQDDQGRTIYHTNVMMGLCTSMVIVCLDSVADPSQRAQLQTTLALHHTVVAITHAQMNSFCGNILEVQGANESKLLVMSSRAFAAFNQDQHDIFAKHVDKIVHVPVPTIEDIGGGGVRCMMGEIF